MGEAAAEGGRGGCCTSAVAQGEEESEGEERNHGGARAAQARVGAPWPGPARQQSTPHGQERAQCGNTRTGAALYGALAHPLARPPLALAEVDLLDTVPVVLVRLVVGRVVSRLGHAAKGPRETRRMRKTLDHGMVVGAV